MMLTHYRVREEYTLEEEYGIEEEVKLTPPPQIKVDPLAELYDIWNSTCIEPMEIEIDTSDYPEFPNETLDSERDFEESC